MHVSDGFSTGEGLSIGASIGKNIGTYLGSVMSSYCRIQPLELKDLQSTVYLHSLSHLTQILVMQLQPFFVVGGMSSWFCLIYSYSPKLSTGNSIVALGINHNFHRGVLVSPPGPHDPPPPHTHTPSPFPMWPPSITPKLLCFFYYGFKLLFVASFRFWRSVLGHGPRFQQILALLQCHYRRTYWQNPYKRVK